MWPNQTLCVPTREAGPREVTEDLPGEGGVASDTRLRGGRPLRRARALKEEEEEEEPATHPEGESGVPHLNPPSLFGPE